MSRNQTKQADSDTVKEQIMLKVVSIVVKDNTNEVVVKLKKINDLYNKILELKKYQLELHQ